MTRTLLTHPDPYTLEHPVLNWLEQHPEAQVLLPNAGSVEHLRNLRPHLAQTLRQFAHRTLERQGLKPLSVQGCEKVLRESASTLTLEYLNPLLDFGRGLDALLEQVREFLRAELNPVALLSVAESGRERDLAQLYRVYTEGLQAQQGYDAQVPEYFAARVRSEQKPTLVCGFPYLDAAQQALVNAACGPGSVLTLPWAEGEDGGAFHEAGRVRTQMLACGWTTQALEDPPERTHARSFLLGDRSGQHFTCTAPTPEAEVSAALDYLEARLSGGVSFEALAVVVRDEATYLPLLEELATERHLPLSGGMIVPLTQTPLGKLVLEVVGRLAQATDLQDLASHPLWNPEIPLEELHLSRYTSRSELAGILWAFLERHLQPAAEDERHRLISRRVQQIMFDSELGAEEFKAVTFLAQLERALNRAGVPRFPALDGIRVLTPLGTAGRRFEAIWILGLAYEHFPAALTPDTLLGAQSRERFRTAGALLRDLAERQDLEAALFHLAASSTKSELVLSRPVRDANGTLLLPSPFWERLGSGHPLEPVTQSLRTHLPDSEAQMRAQRELARAAGTPGPHGGQLEDIVDAQEWTWSASQLHDFGVCRFKWFAGKVLNLRAPNAARSSDARARGDLAHLTLQLLLEPFVGQRPHSEELVEALPAALEEAESIAESKGEWIPEPLWTLERVALLEELRGAVRAEDFIPPGFTISALEQRVSGHVVMGGQTWGLRGVVDRLDWGNGGLRLTDYKSGSYISKVREAGKAKAELEIQLPLYILLSHANSGRYYSLKQAEVIGVAGADPEHWAKHLERLNGFMAGVALHLEAGDIAADPGPRREPCHMCDLSAVCRLQAAPLEAGVA